MHQPYNDERPRLPASKTVSALVHPQQRNAVMNMDDLKPKLNPREADLRDRRETIITLLAICGICLAVMMRSVGL